MELKNQVAVVTGGGLNIGLTISTALAEAGAFVVVADVNAGAADEALGTLRRAEGPGHRSMAVDITREEDVRRLAETVKEVYGRVDHLINNAAIAGPHAYVEDISLETWRQSMSVNLDGVFLACKYFVPMMKERGTGNIVNIASVSGKRPLQSRSPYCASKMGVLGLNRCLALELGPFGIRVNAVCPGAVESPRLDLVLRRQSEQSGVPYEEVVAAKKASSPLNTLVPPSAIADAVVYLCGGKGATMITGEDLNVCAGSVMF